MKIGIRSLLAVAFCLLVASSTHAALVTQWDFNSGSLPSSASAQDTHVTGTPTLGVTGFTGNATATITSQALQLGYSGNNAANLNGTVFTLAIATSGATFTSFTAAYNVTFNGVTAITGTWSYQLNGTGTFTTISPSEAITAGANLDSLTGIALSPGDSVVLRFTLSGVTGGNSGNVRFDDFTINASTITPVPEPINLALAGFGLIFAVGGARRYFRKQTAA